MSTTSAHEMGLIEHAAGGVTVTFERRYAASAAAVWRALTEPDEVAKWLSDASIDLRAGGAIEVRFDDGTMNGLITELVPGSVLAYSWHEGGPHTSHVRWQLTVDGDATILKLVHTKLPTDEATGFAAGWHHHLERLETVVYGTLKDWDWNRFEELKAEYSRPDG